MGRTFVADGARRHAGRAGALVAVAVVSMLGGGEPARAMRRGCQVASPATGLRCARKAATPGAKGGEPKGGEPKRAGKAPAIETSGVSPAADNTMPLLRPGTFRLDLAGFAAIHPILGIGPPHASRTDLFETVTLGYGVNARLTMFAGALEGNSDRDGGPYQADYIDPKVGLIYRLAAAPALHGATLDFAGDVTINEPFGGGSLYGGRPQSDLGPVGRARFLLTREIARGFTLEGIGGLQAAQVTTDWPYGRLLHRTATDVDLLLGLAGQYRLGFISDRLYVNGELDYMKPLTADTDQLMIDSPFQTNESYAATLGASYVLKPGSVLARVTDTVALDRANPNEPFPFRGGRELFDTVGITLSFCNIEPGTWVKRATP